MSFLIAVYVNEGMVLASDRRITYTNTENDGDITIKRIGIHTSNSTDKTFLCPNNAGISTCGVATLLGKPITGFIQSMIREKIKVDTKVEDMPRIIIEHFQAMKQEPDTEFVVAGYDSTDAGQVQRLYRFNVKSNTIIPYDTSAQGAIWDGETYTLTRLIQDVAVKKEDGTYSDLPSESILWNYFTLQDAVDFARYAVGTTIQTMRFKNVIETVGGEVDILVITPEKTWWLQKENLK